MGLLSPRQLTKTLSQNHFKGIEMATKAKIIEKLEDVPSVVLYLKTLPEKAEEGVMVVMEASNQYFTFNNGQWVEEHPYPLSL